MKKFISLLTCLALFFLFQGIIPLRENVAEASGDYQNYLISPTSIIATEDKLFVADEWANELILYDLTSKERLASVTLSGVKKLKISGDKLYALANNNSEIALYAYNLSLQEAQVLSFPSTYQTNGAPIDFVVSEDEIKVLNSDGEESATIDNFTIKNSKLEQILFTSATLSSLGFTNDIKELIAMNITLSEIILVFKTGVYAYNTSTYKLSENYLPSNGVIITHGSENHIMLSNGEIVNLNSKETVTTDQTSCSGITSVGNKVYITNKTTHQVFIVESGSLKDLSLNPEIEPTMFEAKSFKHIKLLASADLKLKPYSVETKRTVESGKHLTVIGETENYYYCLYVGETNEFLYLEKNNNYYEIIEIGEISTSYIVIVNTHIRAFPSSKTNGNPVIGENSPLHASEIVIVKNSTIIQNSSEELFYLVEYDGEFGFIKYSAVQSTRGQYALTTPCNAKIKRATTLFENADGTSELITLNKGTRIAMQEETAPTKDYIKIEYQDENGIIYSGYVLADDIDPDGLSTLQILGLVLVGTNFALLATILIIKRKSKKWKV